MNLKEMSVIAALVNNAQKSTDKSFYCKNAFETELLNWDTLEQTINDCYRITPDTIELIDSNKRKIKIPTIQTEWMRSPRPDPKFVIEKINEGHSLVLLGASRLSRDINDICCIVEDQFNGTSSDVHVYCGLSNSKSFMAHYDFAHNIILHQHGKCYWKIYKQISKDRNELPNIDGKLLDVEFEFFAEPGDFIYIPMLKYHECIPLSKRISLSIPIVNSHNKINRKWHSII